MEKTIEVNGKKFVVRELLAKDVDDIDFNDKKESLKKQVMLSTQMSEGDYNNLTLKERLAVLMAINELNGLMDFQLPKKTD